MSEMRELAMRLAEESELGYFSGVWRANEKKLVCLVRAAMREAYIVAIAACRREAAKESTQRLGLAATGTAYDCANAIRAEAAKLDAANEEG